MVDGVKPLLPASLVNFGRSYAKPIIVLVALAALAVVGWIIVRSLRGRVQPKNPEDLYSQAIAAFEDKNYARAIKKFSAALKNSPDLLTQAKILTNRAESYSKLADTIEKDKLKNQGKALADFDGALGCAPIDSELLIKIYYGKAIILAQQGEHILAIGAFTYAELCKPKDDNFKAELFYKKGLSFFLRGFFQDAAAELRKADDCKSSDTHFCAENLFYLARADRSYNTLEGNQLALKSLGKAINFKPVDVNLSRSIYLERAAIHVEMGNNLQAIDDLTLALKCEPMSNDERVLILVKCGSLKYALGIKDKAQIDFRDAWELKPTDPNVQADLWRHAAMFNAEGGELVSALEALTAAVDCHPTQGLDQCLLERGRVLVGLNRLEDAMNDFSNGINAASNESTKALLYLAKGDTHFKGKDLPSARKDWEKAYECKFANETLRAEISGRFVRNGFV